MGAMFFNTTDCKSSYRIGRGHKTPARALACYPHAGMRGTQGYVVPFQNLEPIPVCSIPADDAVGELESAVRQQSRIQTKPRQPRAGFFT